MRSVIDLRKHAKNYGIKFHWHIAVEKCFTDFYSVYKSIIHQDQHYLVGKETGENSSRRALE